MRENRIPTSGFLYAKIASQTVASKLNEEFISICTESKSSCCKFVDNTAKGQISRWVFQEKKVRQIFRKTNISYPLIHTHTCSYQGVRNVRFLENLTCFVFLKYPFWDSPFRLTANVIWERFIHRFFNILGISHRVHVDLSNYTWFSS